VQFYNQIPTASIFAISDPLPYRLTTLFSITRVTPEEWVDIQTGPTGGVSKPGGDSDHVYCLATSPDNFLTGQDGDLYQVRNIDVLNIRNSFTLVE